MTLILLLCSTLIAVSPLSKSVAASDQHKLVFQSGGVFQKNFSSSGNLCGQQLASVRVNTSAKMGKDKWLGKVDPSSFANAGIKVVFSSHVFNCYNLKTILCRRACDRVHSFTMECELYQQVVKWFGQVESKSAQGRCQRIGKLTGTSFGL